MIVSEWIEGGDEGRLRVWAERDGGGFLRSLDICRDGDEQGQKGLIADSHRVILEGNSSYLLDSLFLSNIVNLFCSRLSLYKLWSVILEIRFSQEAE